MTAYSFATQLAQGEAGEQYLDRFFGAWFRITPATARQQRRGIDRIMHHDRTGQSWAFEYKTDSRAGRTGNAFVEIISQDWGDERRNVRGWAVTCAADFLAYFVTGGDAECIYILRPGRIREHLQRWAARYPRRSVPNASGYSTVGLLVPLDEFERIAEAVY